MATPTLTALSELAERGAGFIEGEGQATALWERRLGPSGERIDLTVSITCVHEGRAARVEAERIDDDGMRRAAKAARLRAGQARAWPSGGLPDPAPGRPHDGFDGDLVAIDPAVLAACLGDPADWSAVATRIAVASTRGVRASEQRSFVAAGGFATIGLARPPQQDPSLRLVPHTGTNRTHVPEPARGGAAMAGGEVAVVLGPRAVAALLDRLRAAFGIDLALGHGPLAGRLGTKVAAPNINLSDSARHPGTLPRSYDAEGVPRRPVALIQDGVAHRGVHDAASAARHGANSSGHATQAATLAPMPDHLVLVGGGAAGIDELAQPIDRGLYVPAFGEPALQIRGGEIGGVAATPPLLEADPLAILASTQALTAAQWLVALRGHCPGGAGAALVPALRATLTPLR